MKKVLKYQAYIWLHNKPISIGMVFVFLLCVGAMLAFAFAYPLSDTPPTPVERQVIRTSYEQELERVAGYLAYYRGETDNIPPIDDEKIWQQMYDYCVFFLETDTCDYDYRVERRDELVVTCSFFVISILLPIIAILTTYFLASTASSPSAKNALAAPMARKTLFRGKILSVWMFVGGLFVLSCLCPLIGSLYDKHSHLFYGNNGCYTLPCVVATFLPRAIAVLIAVFFWSGVTLLCSAAKKRKLMLIIPLSLYVARQIFYYVSRTYLDLFLYLDAVAFLRFADQRIVWFGRSEGGGAAGWIGLGISFLVTVGVCVASFLLYPKYAERLDEVKNVRD